MSDTIEESFAAHAPLAPSSADGWAICADYINANRGLPDLSLKVAKEGTAAHYIRDLCLQTGLDADELVGMVTEYEGEIFSWDEDDADLLQQGINMVRDLGGEFYGEHRVDTSRWTLPGQFGTLDSAVITDDRVYIIDLKFGRGIAVSPVENRQLMLYALGFYDSVVRHRAPNIQLFTLVIDQPRHGGGGGAWNVTLGDLLAFGEWIRGRAAATQQPNAVRTAGLTTCRWCRRRRAPGGCDTWDTYVLDVLGLTWDDLDMGLMMDMPPELPRDLTPERRAYVLLHKDSIKRWLDQLEEEALEDGKAGRDTGIVKVVLGNKLPDKWRDKGVAAVPVVEEYLGDQGFNRRLKSPKQVATAAAGNDEAAQAIAEFIEPGIKKPIIVPLADARQPIVTAEAFDDLTQGNQ